jgi:hypothetical protein
MRRHFTNIDRLLPLNVLLNEVRLNALYKDKPGCQWRPLYD